MSESIVSLASRFSRGTHDMLLNLHAFPPLGDSCKRQRQHCIGVVRLDELNLSTVLEYVATSQKRQKELIGETK